MDSIDLIKLLIFETLNYIKKIIIVIVSKNRVIVIKICIFYSFLYRLIFPNYQIL